MLTLIVLVGIDLHFADKEDSYNVQQQTVNITEDKTKEKPTASLYQGIKISREGLKSYLSVIFTKYGIEDQIPIAEAVIACESSWNINANNGISFGLLQFTPATWKDFGYGDIMNPQSQIITMAKMWKRGLQGRWDCWRMLN